MNEKLDQFENELNSQISRLYEHLENAKKEYKSHLESFGFDDCITRNIANIQMITSKIEAYEHMMDAFGFIFERGKE